MYGLFGNDYTIAFISAGFPPIFGALFMSLIYFVKSPSSFGSFDEITGLEENELKSGNSSPTNMAQSLTATTTLSVEAKSQPESQSLLSINNS